jgi:T-complex protein 1 subunit beta
VGVDISKVQDDEVGDGTTSVTVLAAELMREAETLVNQKIHPQTIVDGYRLASSAAFDALTASAVDNAYTLFPFSNSYLLCLSVCLNNN